MNANTKEINVNTKDAEFKKAVWQYKSARYLLHSTLPSSNNLKLLIAILHNISASLESVVNYLEPKKMGLEAKLVLLRKSKKISQEEIDFMLKLREIIVLQKKSPMEFERKDRHVICDENYALKAISAKEVENYLNWTETFLKKIDPSLVDIK